MNIEQDHKMEGILTKINKKGLAAFFSKQYNPRVEIIMKDDLLFPEEFDKYPT